MTNAIILCSGGLDSITAAHHAKIKLRYKNIILFFCNYKQRAYLGEKYSVKYFSKKLGAKLVECDLSWLNSVSTSQINSKDKAKDMRSVSLKNTEKESSNWYVPCRNLIFLSAALAYAESEFIKNKEKYNIITGFKNDGKETFPDTTKEFADSITKISLSTTLVKSKVISPLIKMDKEDIISLATKYGVPLEKTFSCYIGPKVQCGKCLACILRKEGFHWSNIKDKTIYSKK